MQRLGRTAGAAAVAVALGAGAAGCGGDDGVVVSAAASLAEPLRACLPQDARLQTGGSGELAAQLRQGVRPDVLAAADTAIPRALAAEGLVQRPRTFARNDLVIAVPASGGRVARLEDLGRPGVAVVLGAASVPAGAYAAAVLGRVDAGLRRRIEANVRSREPDVRGVAGKVLQGAADAGFVYRTDVAAGRGRLRAVELPAGLQPDISYGAAVVRGAPHPERAQEILDDLVAGRCAGALRRAGFRAP